MKKQWKSFVSGILVSALIFGLGVTAMAYQQQATLDYTGIKITLNGTPVSPTDASGAAVEPFAMNGTTYLPVRGIANALGLGVSWDQATQTVALTDGNAAVTPPAEVPPAATGYSRTNPAPIGTIQSVAIESILGNYNISAVVLDSLRGDAAWKKIKEANSFNSPAEEGKEYILLNLRLSLDSVEDDAAKSFSSYSFTPYSGTNVEYPSAFAVVPTPSFSGSLYTGGTMEGYVVYAVDTNDTAPKLVIGAKYDGTGGIWFSMV